jgi:hypothetical protein
MLDNDFECTNKSYSAKVGYVSQLPISNLKFQIKNFIFLSSLQDMCLFKIIKTTKKYDVLFFA